MSTTTTDDGMHAGRMDRRRSSSTSRTKKIRYDVTTTMERLRSDMMGSQVIEEDQEQEEEEEKSTGRKSSTRFAETALLPLSLRQGQEESVLVGSAKTTNTPFNLCQGLKQAAGQIPAILLIGMFHMMIGIPFGVSYFPIGWSSSSSTNGDAVDSDGVSGPFPLPGKEALGIRMFLFSTIVGQVVFTFMSGFPNPIGLQVSDDVVFCSRHACVACANSLTTLLLSTNRWWKMFPFVMNCPNWSLTNRAMARTPSALSLSSLELPPSWSASFSIGSDECTWDGSSTTFRLMCWWAALEGLDCTLQRRELRSP